MNWSILLPWATNNISTPRADAKGIYVLAFVISACFGLRREASAEDGLLIWQAIRDSRLSISSGEIEVLKRPQVIDFKSLADAAQKRETTYRFWWDEDSCRIDRQSTNHDQDSSAYVMNVKQVKVANKVLDCWDCDDATSLATEDALMEKSVVLAFRPVALGCSATRFTLASDPERVLDANYAFAGLERIEFEDSPKPALVAKSGEPHPDVEVRISLSSGRRVPEAIMVKRDRFVSETTVEWQEHEANDGSVVDFPLRIEDRFSNDGRLASHTLYDIKVVHLLASVKDDVFTWKGLGIPKNKNVMVRSSGETRYTTWDGEGFTDTVVPSPELDSPELAVSGGARNLAMLLITAGMVLALLFLVVRKHMAA